LSEINGNFKFDTNNYNKKITGKLTITTIIKIIGYLEVTSIIPEGGTMKFVTTIFLFFLVLLFILYVILL